jgi:hypothetical protein
MTEPDQPERLLFAERCKVVSIALAFGAIFTFLVTMAFAFGEPFADVRKYPLDPSGWFVVRARDGSVVRRATYLDMARAKYTIVIWLAVEAGIVLLTLLVFVQGLLGRRTVITRWVLKELARRK